jgi:8-oxo-dGTP diphosphatase
MKIATLGYIRKDGKTLMLHRVKKEHDMHAGKWNGLGGKLEEGETPEECIIREIKEECGLTIHDPVLKGIITFPTPINNDSWYVFLFLITEFEGELIESNEGDLAWVDSDKLFDLNLWAGDKIFIQWLDQKGFFSGKFRYDGEELVEHNFQQYL